MKYIRDCFLELFGFRYYFLIYFFLVVLLERVDCQNIDSLKVRYEKEYKNGNDSLIYNICKIIAFNTSDPKEIVFYANKGLQIGVKLKRRKWQARSKIHLANAYMNMGDLEKAINLLMESEELYLAERYDIGIGIVKLKLADVYKRNKNIDLVILNYSTAINIFKKCNDSIRLAGTYNNLGEFYRLNNRLKKALYLFEKSLDIYILLDYINGIAYAKGNIGLVYTAQNKLDSAEIYLNKSIEILEPLGDNYAVSSYLDGLAEVYFKRKQFNKAKQTAHKSLRLAQEHGLKEQIRDASLRLSTIYDQSKDFEKAFYHHKQYVAYRDSINNEETIRKIANLHTKYEVAQKQKEVDEEKAYKNRYLIIAISAITVLVLLMVLVFIILKISRERRKTNVILEQQRKELENANATKNKFFSILSHDLRSPLATFHSYAEVIEICSQHEDLDKLLILGKELKSSSANMLDLLDNLLQWGVNQMGDQKATPTTVNLKDVALMEVKHLEHVSNKKEIEVNINIIPSVTLFVDRVQLSIAIRNLLNNAIKFTPAGGTVTISATESELHTILKISDTGVGMTTEQKDKLFDFNKINSTYGTQNEKGVGLGMQLVCGFVKENKAKLHVETELGKGTTFAIVFEKR